jgi:hypothetical protein
VEHHQTDKLQHIKDAVTEDITTGEPDDHRRRGFSGLPQSESHNSIRLWSRASTVVRDNETIISKTQRETGIHDDCVFNWMRDGHISEVISHHF